MARIASVFVCLGLSLTTPLLAMAADPETEEEKTIYALGLAVARSLANYNLNEGEMEFVLQGVTDGALGRDPKVDLQEYAPKLQQLAQARAREMAELEKVASAAFLEDMARESGAERFDSGLIMLEMTPGTGASPSATDKVSVHYHGTLRDGKVFDSSVDRGTPASFPLNGVIKCWTEGVQKMKVGGKSKLICPSDIAYGDRGRPPTIQPGAALVFEVELLSIEGQE